MSYELVDRASGDCIKTYSTEAEALAFVASMTSPYNRDPIPDLRLIHIIEGHPTPLAEGKELMWRAERTRCQGCWQVYQTEREVKCCWCSDEEMEQRIG